MKLSDVKGERVFDVVAECIGPIANIAEDKNAKKLFERATVPDEKAKKTLLFDRAKKYLPPLIESHKKDFIILMSSIEGVSEKEYCENLSLAKLMMDCIDLLQDEEFMGLFGLAQRKGAEPSFTSAQENIEG